MISLTPRSLIQQQKQRNNILYGEFILNLDKRTIDNIKSCFKQELIQTQVIDVLKRFTKWWNPSIKNRDEVLELFAKTMFQSATHSESLKINFEQFTTYIIRKMTTLKSIKPETWEIPFIKPSFKLEEYQNINKAIYLPFMKAVCFFQQSSNIIYFFDPIKCQLVLKPLVVGKKKEKKNELYTKQQTLTDTILLNMILIQVENLPILLTSTNDRKVRGWSFGPCSFQQANYPDTRCDAIIQKFTQQVYTMNWDPINQIVYCGFKNGGISLWKINMNIVKAIPYEHNSMIMCMVALPRLYMLATGGIDGKVILWNIAAQQKKWVYKQHTRGVLALAYNQPTFQLFSAGFDHQICIWNPYSSHLINKLQIHQNPIISISLANNHLVSLDSFGNIKITNIKKSNTLLSYNIQTKEPGGVFYLKQQNKLAIYGQSIITLDYETNYNSHLTDNSTPINCYLLSTTEIVTVSNEIIKIWSLLTGSLLRTVTVPLEHITSSLVYQHGIILGDERGNLIFASLNDQPQFKKLPKHSNQINAISCLQTQKEQIKRIIVASTELHILIHLNNKFEILNSIKLHGQEIISIEYHFPSKSILAGTNTGIILIYTEQLVLRQQMIISDCLISSVRFLNNSVLAVSFDNMLYVMSLSPNLMQTQNIKAITNKSRVSTLSVFEDSLYVGFQKGRIQCYDKESMNLKYEIKGHHDAVIFINIINQHDIIVTGGADRMVKIWKLDSGQYIDQFQQDIQIIEKAKKLGDQMVFKATQEKILIQRLKNSYPQIARRSLETKYTNNWNLFINFQKQYSLKKISLKQVEIQDTTTPKIELKQRSITSLFVKRDQSQKQRCSSIKSQINLKLKSNAQKRRISEQKLQRIEIQARRSVDKQLQKIQKTRSRSNKPSYTLSQKQNKSIENMQNMQNFYRKTKINIKTNSMEMRKFSRSFFPNSSTKPVGSKFPKLI